MHQVKTLLFFALLLIILGFRFFFFYQNQPEIHDGQYVSLKTTLLSEPLVVGNQQRVSANLERGNRIFITTSLYPQFHYGDTLYIEGILKHRRLMSGNIILTMSYPKTKIVKNNKNLFLAIPSFIRQKAISLFEKTLPQTPSSLLLGIVFGAKESLPKDFADNLRVSGVFHVVAASGMNVTVVGGFLSSIFGWFLKRQIAILFSIVGILFYAVLAGLEPSIIRASIMGILVFSAQSLGRQNLAFYALFIAAYTMLFYSPILLLDLGFQLSFLATIGLLYIKPLFERSQKVKDILNKSIVGEGAVTTVAAQAATLPILLSNFGGYSLWSVVVNGLVLWTIPTLMVIGGIGGLLGIIFTEGGQLILYASLPFLLYFEKIINFFGKMGGVVALENLPWQFGTAYYLLLCAVVFLFKKRNKF